jgi:hypothetical protein
LLPLSEHTLLISSEQKGRVQFFHCILKMLASLTRASLVDAGTDQGNNNARRRSLYQWSPKDWEEKQKDLEDILEAAEKQTDVFGPSNGETRSKRIANSIDRVKRIIKTNVVVSPLRRKKHGKLNTGDNSEMETTYKAISIEKDPRIKELLSKLLIENHETQSTGQFKEDQELHRILVGETGTFPFALETFPSFVRRIFKKWTSNYSIQHLSRYVSDDKEKITEKIGNDQGGRMSEQPPQKRLKTNTQEAEGQKHASHDNQPTEESQPRRMSEQPPQKRTSDEEQPREESQTPKKAQPKTYARRQQSPKQSQQKKYQGRRAWSEEEKHALKVGIQKYGIGNWAGMKADQSDIFQHRTSGQMKDCYRTMKKRGEIQS